MDPIDDILHQLPDVEETTLRTWAAKLGKQAAILEGLASALYPPPDEAEDSTGFSSLAHGDEEPVKPPTRNSHTARSRRPERGDPEHCRCGCGREVYAQGLARPCYQRALTVVKGGKATWAEIEEDVSLIPAVKPVGFGRRQAKVAAAVPARNGTHRLSKEEVRVAIAMHILREGPTATNTLCELIGETLQGMQEILKHAWFEREADGIHLTNAGLQAMKCQEDDDA